MQVNVLEAKNRLSELIRAVSAGEEVVIANRGVPVARLVGVRQPSDSGSALADWLASHPLPDYARRSAAELDAQIAQERAAWD